MKITKVLLGLLFLTFSFIANAQNKKLSENNQEKISGLMFGDYYDIFAQNHDEYKNLNGFWFRRIYLTYEKKSSKTLTIRLRLELASSGDFNSSSEAILPLVKDAYLKWRFSTNHEMLIGISESPTWRTIEKIWGHRFLEKTPLDIQKWGSSRDFGVGVRGNIFTNGKLKYYFMLGNGSGNKSESNKGKKILSSITWFPTDKLTFEIYGDWNDNTGHTDWMTAQIFGAYKNSRFTLGAQYSVQERLGEITNNTMHILSTFSTYKLNQKWGLVGRIDRNYNPNPKGESISYIPFNNTASNTFYILGVDFKPWKDVTFTPNVEIISYDKNNIGITPNTDVYGRITFYWKF
jgi:hypothetical protein